jgi:hypothetical protein
MHNYYQDRRTKHLKLCTRRFDEVSSYGSDAMKTTREVHNCGTNNVFHINSLVWKHML